MGAVIIDVDQSNVDSSAHEISAAANYFCPAPLSSTDDVSTIPANADGKLAFSSAQFLIQSLGTQMDTEVKSIRDLGENFEVFDSMLSDLWESNPRVPTITQG